MNDTEILDAVLNDLEYSTKESVVLRVELTDSIRKLREEEEAVCAQERFRILENKVDDLNRRFVLHIDCEHPDSGLLFNVNTPHKPHTKPC